MEHFQKRGLFMMDVPSGWHWNEYPDEIIIAYSDGKTMAMDIKMTPSDPMTPAQAKEFLKDGNAQMITQGIKAHRGTLLGQKDFNIDGVYATRLDFKPMPNSPLVATYIAFYTKNTVCTIDYGSEDEKIRAVMDDAVASLRFK